MTQTCAPTWKVSASHGVSIKSWGATPSCNAAVCQDADNGYQQVCCTKPCHVVAHTIPEYDLLDENNPATGAFARARGAPTGTRSADGTMAAFRSAR